MLVKNIKNKSFSFKHNQILIIKRIQSLKSKLILMKIIKSYYSNNLMMKKLNKVYFFNFKFILVNS